MRNRIKNQTDESQGNEMGNGNGSLKELFFDEVADAYSAEQQLTKALPKMAKAAESDDLREAFESHLEETKEHMVRLERAVKEAGESMKRKKCKAMEGLLEEGKDMMDEFDGDAALDAVLIAAAQKVEHYEIATYGTLVAWARRLGYDDCAEALQETLEEEKVADEKLTMIAETIANEEANQND